MTYSTEKALELFHWLCENRCTVQENSIVNSPKWIVFDVDNEMLGTGETPEDATQNTIDRMHNGEIGLCETPTPSLGKYTPRRFRVLREPPPRIKIDGSELYQYGVYFPLHKIVVWDDGKQRKGMKMAEGIEWIDQPPT